MGETDIKILEREMKGAIERQQNNKLKKVEHEEEEKEEFFEDGREDPDLNERLEENEEEE
jgi:general stress protein 26